jgi:hypothetical protein
MELIHARILSEEPEAVVEVIKSWTKAPGTHVEERMSTRIKTYPFRSPGKNYYILFDHAHESYWDTAFWETFFKDSVQHGSGPFAIIFCSYGSPSPEPIDHEDGTPVRLPPCSRVSLTPHTCNDPHHSPVGLLFSQKEFNETLERFRGPDHDVIRLDQELQEMLFEWSMGHAGAIGDLLSLLSRCLTLPDLSDLPQMRKKLRKGDMLNIEDFFNIAPGTVLPETLESLPNFSRGLPQIVQLRTAGVAAVFRKLLTMGSIIEDGDDNVDFCHRHGWIHSEMNLGKTCYTFPSPLHATYVSWRLIPPVIHCQFMTVRDMAFGILKKFVPSQLSSPSRIGVAFSDRPLEARYQYEFYRGLFTATGGGVRICPELLTAPGARRGRINFFVPGKKWGIELIREGSNLAEHSPRFGLRGKYGVWLTSNDMIDYIILDCRTSMPVVPHPRKLPLELRTIQGYVKHHSRNEKPLPCCV